MMKNIVYGVNEKPPVVKLLLSALQQLLAILAATIAVPSIIGHGMSQSAALFGAGIGTIVYLLFTKFRSPVFLGSSFAFLGSMFAAFAGAVTAGAGYIGLILGAIMAGLVYVVLSIVVRFAGTKWIDKLMPPIIIGPTVAIIGLSLAPNAISDLQTSGVDLSKLGLEADVLAKAMTGNLYLCVLCGLVTLIVTTICSVFAKKTLKMIPFIIGILAGYALAAIFTVFGLITDTPALRIINFELFNNIKWLPDFTFITAFKSFGDFGSFGEFMSYFGTITVAYVPVAFVVFAEHIADHKNLSSIIDANLLEEPGLHRTLLGDGVGSMAGAFFGGCPNTTYGESIGCVALSGNASTWTTLATAIFAIVISFFGPFVTLLATIPNCVMGGVCIALYGFIATSGLKMLKDVDLNDNKNIFVISTILVCGIGGLALTFGKVTITAIACALILGIIVNTILNLKKPEAEKEAPLEEEAPSEE